MSRTNKPPLQPCTRGCRSARCPSAPTWSALEPAGPARPHPELPAPPGDHSEGEVYWDCSAASAPGTSRPTNTGQNQHPDPDRQRGPYLRPGSGSACSSCCCIVGNWAAVWRSERWPCGSGSGSGRCNGTWTPGTTSSWGSPPGTSAWGRRDGTGEPSTCASSREDLPDSDRPEEGVMLHTHLPQALGGSVVQQLEADGRLKLVKLVKRGQKVRSRSGQGQVVPSLRGGAFFFYGVSPLQVGS